MRQQIATTLDLCSFRCFFLDKIVEKLRVHAPSDSMEVDGSEDPAGNIHALVNDCKFTMKLEMANSAWKQVKEFFKKKDAEAIFVLSLLYQKNSPCSTNVIFRIIFRWPPNC